MLARPVIQFQEFPDIALIVTTGIVLTAPHERTLLYQMNSEVSSNVVVASRGTAKSAVVCVLYAGYRALLEAGCKIMTLSATGFRGGQLIFIDADAWLRGGWNDQEMEDTMIAASIKNKNILHRGQNMWSIDFDNFSKNTTVPTKDPDSIRGFRANVLLTDEANTIEEELMDKVARKFLAVKTGFKTGGAESQGNQAFYTSTIDYSWRPYLKTVEAAKTGLSRDMRSARAAEEGDWDLYNKLSVEGLNKYTYTQFDYTDTLIRREITNRDGKRFEATWPNPDVPLTHDPMGIPFSERGERGMMQKFGSAVSYYQTYPSDKEQIELGLRDGSSDEAGWLSENRNIVDTSAGDVYPFTIIEKAACAGNHHIIPYKKLPESWKERYASTEADYTAPIMWRCEDPCVLGVDYGAVRDFAAYVVIRVGPLGRGAFNPHTHMGKTPWSSVIWAEQHRKMSAKEAANKVRELCERYNITWFHESHIKDTWKLCRGIGMDMRGGGQAVRDELCFISEEDGVPEGMFRIYDPLDRDERMEAYHSDSNARPMLDAIWPTDELNHRLVDYSLAQMQQGWGLLC